MREAFLSLLRGEPAGEIVWTADVDYWMSGQRQAGRGDPAWDDEEGYVAFCRSLGCMPYYWYGRFWLAQPAYDGVDVTVETDGPRTIRTWRTAAGELVEETRFSETSCSTGTWKYPVQTEADLMTLIHVLERRRLVPDCIDDYPERMALWAKYDGLPGVGLPRSPLPAFIHEWAGVQNGTYMLFDYPDLVGEILRLFEEQEAPIIEAICRARLPLVHFPDNLTSTQFTGLFERCMAGPYRRRLQPLGAAGVASAAHLDGTVRGLLPKLAAVGLTAVEAITPQPAGDVGLHEVRAVAANDRLILWGGLPGAMFVPPYTWDDMSAQLETLLREWGAGPFVVGVADQVPPNGDIDMCRRISDVVRRRAQVNPSIR